MNRRELLVGLTAGVLGAPLIRSAAALASQTRFPASNLSDEAVWRCVAGIRPFRKGSIRLEAERWGDRWMVHAYGHGGGGITMAPGTARVAVELLRERLAPPARVAVLGSGIIGLSTALELIQKGYSVSLYARDFPPNTVSNLAGGFWAPAEVGMGTNDTERALYRRILRLSYDYYDESVSPVLGVYRIPFYLSNGSLQNLNPLPVELKVEKLAHLPFPGQAPAGLGGSTFLIQTSAYMPWLFGDVQKGGTHIERREFTSPEEIKQLDDQAWVNCLGLGAGTLLDDPKVIPIRGQLVILKPTGRNYVVGHDKGYMISRPDMLVAGGTFEEGISDPTPQPEACRKILERNRAFLAA